jgi:hypothetical protein
VPVSTILFERPETRRDELAGRPGVVRFLRLPERRFVMIDGDGPPAAAAFAARMPGLYATAYSLRFALKKRGIEETVGLLEGLWWTTDGTTDLDSIFAGDRAAADDRSTWRWTLLMALPDQALAEELETALDQGRRKLDPPFRNGLRIGPFAEGEVAQLLHLGPYSEERRSIERLHAGIAAAGLRPIGRHHELYVGDPRRSDPDRLRTILRQPVTES